MASSKKTRKAKKRPLMHLDRDFKEWRFEPKPSSTDYIAVVAMSAGAIALGFAFYAMVLRGDASPIEYAKWVLLGGLLLVGVYLWLGAKAAPAVAIGELGVAESKGGRFDRRYWFEITSVDNAHGALRIKTAGTPITLSLETQVAAARRLVAEATRRIPDRVSLDEDIAKRLGKPRESEGEQVEVEAPQVTGEACRASEEPLSFEEDVRLCAGCGVCYHKKHVPRRCLECDARLKS